MRTQETTPSMPTPPPKQTSQPSAADDASRVEASRRFSSSLERSERRADRDTSQRTDRPKEKKSQTEKQPGKPKEKTERRIPSRFGDPLDAIQRQMMAFQPIPGSAGALGGAAAGVSAAGPAGISDAFLQQFVDRVQVGVNEAGASMFQIELKGDVLDGLKVQVSFDKGKIHATFVSESPEIRKMLDENGRHLQQSLRDRGLVVGSLETKDPKEQQREQQQRQHQKEREEASLFA